MRKRRLPDKPISLHPLSFEDAIRAAMATGKPPSLFGTLYTHVSYDNDLRPLEVRFSSPGKFSDTTMGEVLEMLGDAASGLLSALR